MEFAHEQKRCSHRFGRDQRIYARGCGGVHLKQGHRRLSLALGNGISDLHSIAAPIFGSLRTPLTLTSSGGPASGAHRCARLHQRIRSRWRVGTWSCCHPCKCTATIALVIAATSWIPGAIGAPTTVPWFTRLDHMFSCSALM